MTLTSDLQPQESYGQDPYMQKVKVKGHSFQKLEWKWTNRRTETIALLPMLKQSVKCNNALLRQKQCFDTTPECVRHTQRQTHDDDIYRASIVSHGKKHLERSAEALY